ncbi:IclR family transcriptional regulator [Actinomycetes bacterium KLBMP 9797]
MTSGDDTGRRGVRAVDRALDLLSAFSTAHPRLSLSELAEAAGLPRASAHRIAATLVERGFLRQDPDGAYLLGVRLLELGSQVSQTSAVTHLTQQAADELHRLTGETVLIAEVDWDALSYVITGKREGRRPLALASPVGRRSALASGVLAKAALLGLPPESVAAVVPRLRLVPRTTRTIVEPDRLRAAVEASRQRGYAVQYGEYLLGVAGVAAPVSIAGRVAGVLAVIGAASRLPPRRLDETGQQILQVLARLQPV